MNIFQLLNGLTFRSPGLGGLMSGALDASGLNTILHVFFFTEVVGAGRLHVKMHFFVA